MKRVGLVTVAVLFVIADAARAQHPPMPAGMSHEEHLAQLQKEAELKERGAAAMGFDQDAAVHHFTLTATGGTIAVNVKDIRDAQTLTAIRLHLRQIASDFAEGRFDAPFHTHGEVPPGASEMQQHTADLQYAYRETETGGAVDIAVTKSDALAAVHAFLRYQITEHRTGDPLTVK